MGELYEKHRRFTLSMLSKLILATDVMLDKTKEYDEKKGYAFYINGSIETQWFQFSENENTLVISESLNRPSFIPCDNDLFSIVKDKKLSLVICNLSREITLVLTQDETEDIVIIITDVDEKKYNIEDLENLFFNLAKEVADNL